MRHVACDMRLSLLTYLGYVRPVRLSFFFFNDTATTEIYTLSLHDALPISRARSVPEYLKLRFDEKTRGVNAISFACMRSEEHTSELQSRLHLVCRLLLEKKKNCLRVNVA